MYIDADTILRAAAVLGALSVLGTAVWKAFRWFSRQEEQNSRQWRAIHQSQEEQTLICYGVRACLLGLIEQGCNGPCRDALNRLDKHLNKAAHQDGGEKEADGR